jgi:hypothetical protein
MDKKVLDALIKFGLVTNICVDSEKYKDVDDLINKGVITIPGAKPTIERILKDLNVTEPIVVEPVVETEPIVEETVVEPVVETEPIVEETVVEPVEETEPIVEETGQKKRKSKKAE